MTSGDWTGALLAATCLHAGFQLTVTTLVYPALGRLPASAWPREHDLHSRRIVPLVVVTYATVLVATAGALLSSPTVPVLVSTAGSAVALGTTAVRAAPLHGRLGRGGRAHDPALVASLLRADRLRAAGAVVGVAGALLAVL